MIVNNVAKLVLFARLMQSINHFRCRDSNGRRVQETYIGFDLTERTSISQ